MKKITLKGFDYDSVQCRLNVKGHGNLTLFDVSKDGLHNLSGKIYDLDVELNEDKRLLIIGVDEV
jgi:hypothetical protein